MIIFKISRLKYATKIFTGLPNRQKKMHEWLHEQEEKESSAYAAHRLNINQWFALLNFTL